MFRSYLNFYVKMTGCAAFGCTNDSRKGEGYTFHKFPTDKALRDKWCSAMKRKGFKPTKYSKICSAHYRPADFETLSDIGKALKNKRLKSACA